MLVIVTDDQRADTMEAMPATRRWFAGTGVTFERALAPTPVCCPARASLMTGRYAHTHGVRTNSEARRLDPATTMQWALREEGYRTAIAGKYLNRWPVEDDPPGFDDWAIFSPTPTTEGYAGEPFNLDGRVRRVARYSTDVLAERSGSMLRRFEERDDQPWYLYVAPFAPHEPALPASRHADAPVAPGPRAEEETDRSDKPPAVRRSPPSGALGSTVRTRQLRALMAVDELVDGLFRDLRELGEARRTLAVFTSDNGHLWGEHGLVEKGWPYAPSTAVPLMLRWPGHVEPGTTDRRLAALIDVAPTVLEAAGLQADADGRSLFDRDPRGRLLLEHWRGGRADIPTWASLLTHRWQYVEYYRAGRVTFREYYDLRRDPAQQRNLLGDADPSNDPPGLERLAGALAAARTCRGPACP